MSGTNRDRTEIAAGWVRDRSVPHNSRHRVPLKHETITRAMAKDMNVSWPRCPADTHRFNEEYNESLQRKRQRLMYVLETIVF